MIEHKAPETRRVGVVVRRLLEAIDRAIAAGRDVEQARQALTREAERLPFRVVGEEAADE